MQKLIIAIVTSLVLSQTAWARQPVSEQALVDLERYRAQLEDLENQVGRYHPLLLETLQRLAAAMIELDQFNETDEILDRAIQILRISEGLYTESQFSFLVLSIRNNVRRGNWRDANDDLDHLTWLYTFVPRQWNGELVNELLQISNLHLEGVAGDLAERKDYHFRSSDRISWVAAQVGERIWSPDDPRLVGLYYRLAIQNHMKYLTLNQGGEASADLRQIVPNAGWMRSRRMVAQSYYGVGIEMLRRMRQVYEIQDPPDPEAIAMVDLYRADWQVMFDEGSPDDSYHRVYHNLLATGVSENALREFFSRPQILPVMEFYPSVRQAVAARSAAAEAEVAVPSQQSGLLFLEWASTSPNMQLPIQQPLLLQQEIEDMKSIQVAFSLDGTDNISRWIRGRYVSQISVADEFEWLNPTADHTISREELEERLHYVNFRPVLEQGVPQSYEGVLEYRYFPVDRE